MTPSRSIQALMRMVLGAAGGVGGRGAAAPGTPPGAGGGGAAAGAPGGGGGGGPLRGPQGAGHASPAAARPLPSPGATVAAVVILGLAGMGFIPLGRAGRPPRRYAMATRRFRRVAA